MLRLDLKPGESVRIGNYATITLEAKAGKAARIAFQADKGITISRIQPAPPQEKKSNPLHGIAAALA